MTLQENDIVALTVDLPEPSLPKGSVGTVVFVYSPTDVEVEFIDNDGYTYGLTRLNTSQLLRLKFNPAAA